MAQRTFFATSSIFGCTQQPVNIYSLELNKLNIWPLFIRNQHMSLLKNKKHFLWSPLPSDLSPRTTELVNSWTSVCACMRACVCVIRFLQLRQMICLWWGRFVRGKDKAIWVTVVAASPTTLGYLDTHSRWDLRMWEFMGFGDWPSP